MVTSLFKHIVRRSGRSLPTAFAVLLPACGLVSACSGNPTGPTSQAVATIQVGAETFRVLLTTADQVTAARAAQNGASAHIPIGRIVMGTQVNVGYSWHLEDVSFADSMIELCDGAPSMVERQGTAFGGGRFCPWAARVTAVSGL